MCPFELTATPATSPRCMSGGSLSRLATESYGISGGGCCASADGPSSTKSPTSHRFMVTSLACRGDLFAAWHEYTNRSRCNTIASAVSQRQGRNKRQETKAGDRRHALY